MTSSCRNDFKKAVMEELPLNNSDLVDNTQFKMITIKIDIETDLRFSPSFHKMFKDGII
jgi:hypothetical protein